jgi:hypothetical protein
MPQNKDDYETDGKKRKCVQCTRECGQKHAVTSFFLLKVKMSK